MANTIALAQQFVPLLDEVYKNASLTSVLDGANDLATAGANANELIIPMLNMQGLGDYSRNGGYVDGDVSLTNQTVKCNFDRGRMFSVDAMDNIETAGIAFGRLATEFIRTKVVPELDAFRFASLAGKAGIGSANGAITTGKDAVDAIRAGVLALDNAEVPTEERYLFILPQVLALISDMDTTASREVLAGFAGTVKVPPARFNTAISQKDGTTEGEKEGGYTVAGKTINFMIVHKPAVIQFEKHVVPKIITPEANQKADAWKFGYRNVGISDVYANKVAGIYEHHAV